MSGAQPPPPNTGQKLLIIVGFESEFYMADIFLSRVYWPALRGVISYLPHENFLGGQI